MKLGDPHRTYFAVIDSAAGTITRHVHHRGTWGVRHLRTVRVEKPELLAELGTAEARTMIEQFRANGVIS